jgi:ankyrin repeat protein
MAHAHDAGGGGAPAGGGAPRPSPPFTFLDMPCDLLTCLGPVANTPGYEREVDGTQRLCRTARDDTMLGAATADLRYETRYMFEARFMGPRSRLAYACMMNDHARIAWLLECGARHVTAAAQPGYTGGAALVRRLAGDPLVDATEALRVAARVGAADVVAPLVARGAAVDAADNSRVTALVHAAFNGHLEVVQALVAAGADVNRRDEDGTSVAAFATRNELVVGEPAAAYLCALPQAEPGAHIAAAAWLGDVQRVRDFIARGASVEERGRFGATCLMLAAQRGHAEVVRVLLAAGADVNADDGHGTYPMWYAVGHPPILAALLARFEVGGDARRWAMMDQALRHAMRLRTPEGAECARMLRAADVVRLPPMR